MAQDNLTLTDLLSDIHGLVVKIVAANPRVKRKIGRNRGVFERMIFLDNRQYHLRVDKMRYDTDAEIASGEAYYIRIVKRPSGDCFVEESQPMSLKSDVDQLRALYKQMSGIHDNNKSGGS